MIDLVQEGEVDQPYKNRKREKVVTKKADHKHKYENIMVEDENGDSYCIISFCRKCGKTNEFNTRCLTGVKIKELIDNYNETSTPVLFVASCPPNELKDEIKKIIPVYHANKDEIKNSMAIFAFYDLKYLDLDRVEEIEG